MNPDRLERLDLVLRWVGTGGISGVAAALLSLGIAYLYDSHIGSKSPDAEIWIVWTVIFVPILFFVGAFAGAMVGVLFVKRGRRKDPTTTTKGL